MFVGCMSAAATKRLIFSLYLIKTGSEGFIAPFPSYPDVISPREECRQGQERVRLGTGLARMSAKAEPTQQTYLQSFLFLKLYSNNKDNNYDNNNS